MAKSRKELAFLRDLYVSPDWTERFTSLVDENLKFEKDERVLYVNAGAGNHALALRTRLDRTSKLFCVCDDEELLGIAKAKATVIGADIDFATEIPERLFSMIIANASLIEPSELEHFVKTLVERSNGTVNIFLPTAGSFGEIFSFLWETLWELDLLDHGVEVEKLITELPTVSRVEEMAVECGLSKIVLRTKNEIFEYETGDDFIASPLVAEFLFPHWMGKLNSKEKEQVKKSLAQKITEEHRDLSFRFSVKATVIYGEKYLALTR